MTTVAEAVPTRANVRRQIVNVARDHREAVDVRHDKARITAKIARRLDTIAKRLETRRSKIEEYVRAHGPVKFPGVGGAELVTVPTHVRITDAAAALETLFDVLPTHPEGLGIAEVTVVLKRAEFRKWAARELELDEFGVVRHKASGAAFPGVELVPEHLTVRVRT